MGRSGIAFSFVSKDEGERLTEIEHRINRLLERDPLSEAPVSKRAVPIAISADTMPRPPAPQFGEAKVADKRPRWNRLRRKS